MRSDLTDRTHVAMRFASSRQRLDLGSIFGAKHQSSRTPPVERHGTPRNRPTRTGRQQQGRAPNQDKRRLGARQQRQPSRGRGTRGPRSIGLLMNNELCAGGGWGSGAADAGLPMGLGIGLPCRRTWRGGLGMACSYAPGCFGTFGGRFLSVPYGFRVMPDL